MVYPILIVYNIVSLTIVYPILIVYNIVSLTMVYPILIAHFVWILINLNIVSGDKKKNKCKKNFTADTNLSSINVCLSQMNTCIVWLFI